MTTFISPPKATHRIVQYIWAELRRIAEIEGPDAMYVLHTCDVAADYMPGRNAVRAVVSFKGLPPRMVEMRVTPESMNSDSPEAAILHKDVTKAMMQNLSLVGQKVLHDLDKKMPKYVQDVQCRYNVQKLEREFVVIFKNGHELVAEEREVKTDEFLARCLMVYDLPERS